MWKLEKMKQYADQIIEKNGIDAGGAHHRPAGGAGGADFVILIFQIGGIAAYEADIDIPDEVQGGPVHRRFHGPGGVFRVLRGVPVMMEIWEDMKELCPNAYVLNYVNPMGAMCTPWPGPPG